MAFRKSKLMLVGCTAATFVGVASLIRNPLFGGPEYEGNENLFGRTYVVTGANSGIGRATVDALASRGARVILACRNEEEGVKATEDITHDTYNRQVVYKHLDLSSLKSIRTFAADLVANETRIDGLVNNAGVKEPKKREVTEDGFELQFGVNHLGHFLLTYLLIGKLQSSSPSRIVNLTDIAHRRGAISFEDLNSDGKYHAADAYKQSKLAQAVFTKELSRRLEGSGVTAYAVHPGFVRTKIDRNLSVDSSYIAKVFVKPFFWFFHKTPEQGARTVIYCLLSPDVTDKSGGYFKDCEHRKLADDAEDPIIAKRLWMTSEVWTGLKQINVLNGDAEKYEGFSESSSAEAAVEMTS